MIFLRRRLSQLLAAKPLLGLPYAKASETKNSSDAFYAQVKPYPANSGMRFPRDFGAHSDFRTEWWYVTGWLDNAVGFQITFFRSRTQHNATNPSRFAPTQLLLAHAALALPENKALLHDQIASRMHPKLATYSENDCAIHMQQQARVWSLKRSTDNTYKIAVHAADFQFELTLVATETPWLQGNAGFSSKGPQAHHASFYYSLPQLKTSGEIKYALKGKTTQRKVSGVSWFDHEWSSALLAQDAVGWDWLGLNLLDGSALTIFRIRDVKGESIHTYAAIRLANGKVTQFKPVFTSLRTWLSPRTATTYPVAWQIDLRSSEQPTLSISVNPLMDDQELDSRRSTGAIYWEGAVEVFQKSSQTPIGRGYLELTGYHQPLKM
jgi:predicted secreted hydrolase